MSVSAIESTAKAKKRQHVNGEVGSKDTKERGSGGDKLVIISGSPFGAFKKRLVMGCMAFPSAALMAAAWVESDGSLMYVNTYWLTGTVFVIGMLTLLFAKME